MPVQLMIEVPDNAFSVLRVGPEDFVQEMKMAAIVKTTREELEKEIARA